MLKVKPVTPTKRERITQFYKTHRQNLSNSETAIQELGHALGERNRETEEQRPRTTTKNTPRTPP